MASRWTNAFSVCLACPPNCSLKFCGATGKKALCNMWVQHIMDNHMTSHIVTNTSIMCLNWSHRSGACLKQQQHINTPLPVTIHLWSSLLPSPGPREIPGCTGQCQLTFCHACYFSKEVRDLPGQCRACGSPVSSLKCLQRWAICIHWADIKENGKVLLLPSLPFPPLPMRMHFNFIPSSFTPRQFISVFISTAWPFVHHPGEVQVLPIPLWTQRLISPWQPTYLVFTVDYEMFSLFREGTFVFVCKFSGIVT